MRTITGLFSVILLVFSVGDAAAQSALSDTMENRRILAQRYAAVSMPIVMKDLVEASAKAIPPGPTRDAYLQASRETLTVEKATMLAAPAIAKTYTTTEIQALIDFHSTPVGLAILKKSSAYLANVQPAMMMMIRETTARMKQIMSNRKQ